MVKKRGLITTIFLVLVLASANLFFFFNSGDTSYSGMSGKFIDEIPEMPLNLSFPTVIFIAQWIILILILVITYSKFLKHKKHEITSKDYAIIKERKTKSETDLDVFYHLLKSKKNLSMITISKLFKIPREKALEWAKILEKHELGIIEYPAFSDPEIRLKEDEKEQKKETEKERKDREKREKQTGKEKGEEKKPKQEREKGVQKTEKREEKRKKEQKRRPEKTKQKSKRKRK